MHLNGMLLYRRLLPPGWDASLSQVTPQHSVRLLHLHSWVKRGTVRVKCLAQAHNTVPRPGLEPAPLDLESNELTIRPLRLSWIGRITHTYENDQTKQERRK